MTEFCPHCDEAVLPDDELARGRLYDQHGRVRQVHRECALRVVLGGIGHHLDHDYWCLEKHDPDAGMTFRQSARHVDRLVQGWVDN